MTMKKFIMNDVEAENCGLITRRDRSEVYKVKWNGDFYCWKIISDDERFNHTYEQAYKNYTAVKDKSGLVMVRCTWRDNDGRFNVLMEYLEGFRRLEYIENDPRVYEIEAKLINEGFFMFDFAPINFMVKGEDIRMIDLDTLAKIDDFIVNQNDVIPELLWYGSRAIKERSRGKCLAFERGYKPNEQ